MNNSSRSVLCSEITGPDRTPKDKNQVHVAKRNVISVSEHCERHQELIAEITVPSQDCRSVVLTQTLSGD